MANFLPRFEWNDRSVIGECVDTTLVISGIASTANLVEGMLINNPAFPADAKIISKTLTTVTLDKPATLTLSDETFNFFERFDFVLPSEKQCEPVLLPTEQISTSLSGKNQTMILNVIEEVELAFKFITKAETDILRTRWYWLWAMYGKDFRYFESNDETAFVNTALKKLDWKPVRAIPKGGNFIYEIPFSFRRVAL